MEGLAQAVVEMARKKKDPEVLIPARVLSNVAFNEKTRHIVNADRLARSKSLWERRIAMIATAAWIAGGDTADAYAIADLLLDDPHDLIRKAVGWMLREAGVHDRAALLRFLRTRYARVSRTTLRYAIEHLPQAQRKRILAGHFAG